MYTKQSKIILNSIGAFPPKKFNIRIHLIPILKKYHLISYHCEKLFEEFFQKPQDFTCGEYDGPFRIYAATPVLRLVEGWYLSCDVLVLLGVK
jgi:hypothetical protein